ncbi:MAG: hypothetical protein NZ480_05220 [Bdellovibrionaceae bacterium]|nr:hypothetical protein [Pseudobdellovibrionaceae bacterium]MDW8191087.1 hypothetical protein [Pseudobdellovibrionaceae bacterium]
MWNIQYQPYRLRLAIPHSHKKEHALVGVVISLRDVTLSRGYRMGFADLRPWPELGDLPLMNYQEKLNRYTQRLWKKMELLEVIQLEQDPLFRAVLRNLWDFYRYGPAIREWIRKKRGWPSCNELILDVKGFWARKDSSFRTMNFRIPQVIKIKLREGDWENPWWLKLSRLFPRARWRLDLNCSGNPEELLRWINQLEHSIKRRIEYIEDPSIYDEDGWRAINQHIPVALDFALDWHSDTFLRGKRRKAFSVLVFKPSRQNVDEVPGKDIPLTVTTHLGHFVDWLWSWWMFARLKDKGYKVNSVSGLTYFFSDGL